LAKIEKLRAKKNEASREITKAKSPKKIISSMKKLDKEEDKLKKDFKKRDQEFLKLMGQVPNLPLDDVPEGNDESENVILKEVGKRPKFSFKFKDYLKIAEKLDLIDIKRAAKTSGSRFGFLKNEAALLELALVNFAFEKLFEKGFSPVIPPVLLRPEMMKGMGYVERGGEEIYFIEKDNLFLIGTSEQIIGPMHSGEVFDGKNLPKRYAAFSPCFRREAGSYGRDTRGILRVHQFDKVEMFVFSKPEESKGEHESLLSIEEEFMKELGIPYRVVKICTGDLGNPAASKYDIEAWIPSENRYRETHSTSNCTDFQARRLNIRYRAKGGKLEFVHTLNGTALAIGRTLISIIENCQQEDGSILVPEVLRKYTKFEKIG